MNRNIRTAAGANRNLGLHGAGKGDADRTTNTSAYAQNFSEVTFPPSTGFTKSKRGWKKTYGTPTTLWGGARFEEGLI